MSIDEFLSKLSRLRHKGSKKKVKWMFDNIGAIRSIAGNSAINSKGYKHCPITAVYKAEKDVNVYLYSAPAAAIDLELDKHNTNTIIAAADNIAMGDSNVYVLRQKLLKACGLTEGEWGI